MGVWIYQHNKDSPNFEIVGDAVVIEDYAWLSCWVVNLPGFTV